jgi:hypothetical protein
MLRHPSAVSPELLIEVVAGRGPWGDAFPPEMKHLMSGGDPSGWISAVERGHLRTHRALAAEEASSLTDLLLRSGVTREQPSFRASANTADGATYVHFAGEVDGAPFALRYSGFALDSVRGTRFREWRAFGEALLRAANVSLRQNWLQESEDG